MARNKMESSSMYSSIVRKSKYCLAPTAALIVMEDCINF